MLCETTIEGDDTDALEKYVMNARKYTVMIVDDIALNVQTMASNLRSKYDIISAFSGQEALELAASRLPDVIILDILMPDMDGFAVCRQLKADPRTEGIPVIFLTVMDEVENEAYGLEIGAVDYITQPISPVILQARLDIHLKLKRQQEMLLEVSMMDGLTGIANRRRFDQALECEWRHHLRQRAPLSLIMADIDCFKLLNDHYGHLVGDDCLKMVAATMAGLMRRPADLVARFGGEEFVCLLPETPPDGAAHMANALREAVAALAFPHAYSTATNHVTISLGVASLTPEDGMASSALVDLADRRLYGAKRNGRNRICDS